VDAIVSRTGYTGEDGFELYFLAAESERVWNEIIDRGAPVGLLPAGLARETHFDLKPISSYGNDMDGTTTMLEAGLDGLSDCEKASSLAAKRCEAEARRRQARGWLD
jgi:aminomethyltransferase